MVRPTGMAREPALVWRATVFEYLRARRTRCTSGLLSKYRSYTECPTCAGARLKTESLLWRIGSKEQADAVLAPEAVHAAGRAVEPCPTGGVAGLCLHDLMLLPLERLRRFFDALEAGYENQAGMARSTPEAEIKTLEAVARRNPHPPEIPVRCRHRLPHARPPKPHALSGGEVQRINLTTALGTSLVNTLFS